MPKQKTKRITESVSMAPRPKCMKSHFRLSIRNTMRSAFDGARRFRFFDITSPAFENRRSLGTDVAGIASRRRATTVTAG